MTDPVLPGTWLGLLGGGQLGCFFTIAARQMGYRVMVLDPDPESPAGALADAHLIAGYTDARAIRKLADTCAAVTTEIKNVPARTLAMLSDTCIVAPPADAVATAQDRVAEKRFLLDIGMQIAPFAEIRDAEDFDNPDLGALFPGTLKCAREGYDGRGQTRVESLEAARTAWTEFDERHCMLEKRLPLDRELSVVLARGGDCEIRTYPVAENRHRGGILDTSVLPAPQSDTLAQQATLCAVAIATEMNYTGVLAVEFFVSEERLLVNEIAPRPPQQRPLNA